MSRVSCRAITSRPIGSHRTSRFGHPLRYRAGLLAIALLMVVTTACRQDMHDQPKYEPLEASSLFADGKSARPLVEGTVARGMLREDTVYFTGRTPADEFAVELPVELDRDLLERGRSRFNAFCSPCHGLLGDGNGMVVQRGFKHPQSFHEQRLLAMRIGYFFHVMTNGFGEMSSYASQVPPDDRWAIAAYIRTLQMSQSLSASELTPDEVEQVEYAGEEPVSGEQQESH